MKWIPEINKCKYSVRKKNNSIDPLYSVQYPATTSASVSAWSKGVLLASNKTSIMKLNTIGVKAKKNHKDVWNQIISKKFADWEKKTNVEKIIVIKISKEITWIKPRIIPNMAYLDWLKKPTKEKKIFPIKIKIKWWRTIESTFEIEKHIESKIIFCEKKSWLVYNKNKKKGAKAAVGFGIKKISFEINLTRSKTIWKKPFRPANVGPIRRWA